MNVNIFGMPKKNGLYNPQYEHDACGIGFVVNIKNKKSHFIIEKGLDLLENLEHRGATGVDKNSGDGAGVQIQIPHEFLLSECSKLNISLNSPGKYGVGMFFLPSKANARQEIKNLFSNCAEECNIDILGWRDVPVNNESLGLASTSTEPKIEQVFVESQDNTIDQDTLERKLYVLRKYSEKVIKDTNLEQKNYYYPCSLSTRTVIYKGMLTTKQVRLYFTDLSNRKFKSAFAMTHSRFSTNTFPTWSLAQPFRYLCHNGEINTLRGNINWMKAREAILESDVFSSEDLAKIKPVILEGQSDSASLDNVVELLTVAGRSIAHVMMMLIPEAWQKDLNMASNKRAFYEYHATLMEPWDGPASVAFTNGKEIGATLDRNGLRPSRWSLTSDDFLVLGSEAGSIEFPSNKVISKGRLQPGKMLLVDLEEGKIIEDEELKQIICTQQPYVKWIEKGKVEIDQIYQPLNPTLLEHRSIRKKQKQFGYTLEDLRTIIIPMAEKGKEPFGSMGADTPIALLSNKSQSLFNYFKQLFAQVTNPPIDPIRESLVMSLISFIGKQDNILDENPGHCNLLEIPQPILTNGQFEKLRWIDERNFTAKTISITFPVNEDKQNRLKSSIEKIKRNAVEAIHDGYNIIILSDRGANSQHAPIPSLLAVSVVHHHLIRERLRAKCGLVIETGEPREVHHFACLLSFGASAINPYLAFETIKDIKKIDFIKEKISEEDLIKNYIQSINTGLLKILSKMGISTIQSYIGAQIFEALGLGSSLIRDYFPGTTSRIGGLDIKTLEEETLIRQRNAYPKKEKEALELDLGGQYAWRHRGEKHLHNPDTIHLLQHSLRTNDYALYKKFAKQVNNQEKEMITLRGQMEFTGYDSVDISEVESAKNIYPRFSTGAMSYGSISWEAHTTLAIAMNRIGGKSNTGEGGEDPIRFKMEPGKDSLRSAIKQVASGRFGVTSNYLANSDEIQIKIAQGAKPGEGGQLPGYKVNKVIGKTRHSTPGVELISPPPHHDIYSIEDLAQLIYDLKNANAQSRISVKLVSEMGVGTIATGVAKGHADAILVAGAAGGTGASPLSSIRHAGLPWELGVAETHQTLVMNGMRDRVVLQTDGLMRTGKDLAVAAMLGAEEWGVATGSLIAAGCIMMRKCHLNTCPVGIATQDKDLRRLFTGNADHVVNYFKFLVEDLRNIMAKLGFKTVNEMIGRVDKLKQKKTQHWKAKHLNLDAILKKAESFHPNNANYCCKAQDHGLEREVNYGLIEKSLKAIKNKEKVRFNIQLKNIHRSVGTALSTEISRHYGDEGLPEDTITVHAKGSAGQSFGAFAAKGLTIHLEGEANDYFGKGLSGAKLILKQPEGSPFIAHKNVIVGNVAFYGATSGEAYIRGLGGERFCVRNSGVEVVVGSVGDHGCEYMTGGRVIILGDIGRNFAAGMSGGIAYIWDESGNNKTRINLDLVELEEILLEDEKYLKSKIQKYIDYTGSIHSREILQNWNKEKKSFIKVMPRDYKVALKKIKEEKMRKKAS